MQGTGGFLKLRWQDPRRGKGKRAGLRLICWYLTSNRQIWRFTVYAKDESAELGADGKRALTEAMQTELAARWRKR